MISRQFDDRDLVGIAEVYRAGLVRHEHAEKPFDKIADVAEAAGLAAISVDGQRLTVNCLRDEVRHDPAIARAEPRTVGVEDPDDAGIDALARRCAMNSASAYLLDSS